MKLKLITLAFLGFVSSLSATTVTATGGTTGAFFYTSNDTLLTKTNSTISAGLWNGTLFTAFAASDVTPITISDNASLLGRWAGGYTDNNNVTASPFNGLAVWFRITTTADAGGTAYVSGAGLFPNANGGVSDSVSITSLSLTTLGAGSSVNSRAYNVSDGKIIVGVTAPIPEPSAALLGAFGVLGLLRRRRN